MWEGDRERDREREFMYSLLGTTGSRESGRDAGHADAQAPPLYCALFYVGFRVYAFKDLAKSMLTSVVSK